MTKSSRTRALATQATELMADLTPAENLAFLQDLTERAINLTPTGLERAALTESNIRLMIGARG